MFLPILYLVHILPILSYDIPTCLKQTDDFHHAKVEYEPNQSPTLKIALKNQEIHHRARKCFALDIKTDAAHQFNTYQPKKINKKNRFLHVHLKDVWQEYSVKREYHFVLPQVSAKCKCYCKHTPLCGHHYEHDSAFNTPNKPNGTWNDEINYGIYKHKRYTCKDTGHSGYVCCNVTVRGDYADRLHAIYMEMGRIHYEVEIAVIDKDGKATSREKSVQFATDTFPVSFDGGSGEMKVWDYGQFDKIPAQWGLVDPQRPSEIKINGQEINGVKETSVGKVGWYKWTSEGEFRTADRTQIEGAFRAIVLDCDGNQMDWRFHANGWQGHRNDGDLLEEYYADFVEKVEYESERKVVNVRHKRKPQIRADIAFSVPLERLLVLGNSNFCRFDARYDWRAKMLIVDVQDAYGKLTLEVYEHNTTEKLLTQTFVVISLSLLNFTKRWNLDVSDDGDGFLRVCLSTVGKSPKTQRCVSCLINGNETQAQAQVLDYESNGCSEEKTCRLMTIVCVVVWISVLFFQRVG